MLKNGPQPKRSSYYEYYAAYIKPAINRLDIAIKCKTRLKNKDIAEILNLSEAEVERIRSLHNIKTINRDGILKILENGGSGICRLYQREMEAGSPHTYTKEQFAYIYGLDMELVTKACDLLSIHEITWQNMPEVFRAIPYDAKWKHTS